MKKLLSLFLLCLVATTLTAQLTYTPPVLPPIFSASDLGNSAQLMTNVNANVKVYTDLLVKHDTDLYSPTGSVATAISKIPAGPQGPAGASTVPTISAISGFAFSGAAPPVELGICTPINDISPTVAGQTVDFSVPVAVAGSYKFVACIASGTTMSAPWSLHFEYPVGTNLGSLSQASIPSPLNNWSVFRQVSSRSVVLPAGVITVRVVFETTTFNFGGFSIQ